MLQARAQDLQRVRALQREMAALRDQLLDLAARVSSVESEVQDWEQLEKKIQQVQVSNIFHLKVYGQTEVDVECKVVSFCDMC
jgi:predicted  nucleic acid-binding Zn-ribbon protein